MKKRSNLFKTLGIAVIAGTVTLFAACGSTQSDVTVNNAGASQTQAQSVTAQSITLETAIEIALNHAGVARENARFTKTQLDGDDKVKNYEIEFVTDEKEYEYEIAVSDGTVLKGRTELRIKTDAESKKNSADVSSSKADAAAQTTKAQKAGYISIDDAKAAALAHVGATADKAVFEDAEFDRDDSVPHYDIEFYYNNKEYDFEVDAETGKILLMTSNKFAPEAANNSTGYITAQQAKEKALAHAGVKAADAKFVKAELDRDNGVPKYEIEFKSGNYEYEYDIQAETGTVLNYEKDFDD